MEELYFKIFIQDALSSIKQLKNRWNETVDNIVDEDNNYFYFSDSVDLQYSFIQDQVNAITEDALNKVVIGLLNNYKRKPHIIFINWKAFNGQEIEELDDEKVQDNKELFCCYTGGNGRLLSYIEDEGDESVYYVFKKYGLPYCVSDSLINKLKQKYSFNNVKIISFVPCNAYRELLDTADPEITENTINNRYSFQYYIKNKYGDQEYKNFEDAINSFNEKIKDYLGIAVLRTLKPNAVFGYKNKLLDDIKNIKYNELISENDYICVSLEHDQQKLIDEQFFEDGYYKAIVGYSDFARSFITSEWLYNSLQKPGYIDLTAIVMGYLKAAEQFLYSFMFFFTEERTKDTTLTFDAGKRKYLSLTKKMLEKERKYISLDNITYFFQNNTCLLRSDIRQNESTLTIIKAVLNATKRLRNGFFHKDNMYEDDWDKVKAIRSTTLSLFYLFLGSYDLSRISKKELGIRNDFGKSDFYKLCEYVNALALKEPGQETPILYIHGRIFKCCPDVDIKYDDEDLPIYSGVCVQPLAPRKSEHLGKDDYFVIEEDNVPDEIMEGRLTIHMKEQLEIKDTGPEKTIFKNGEFLVY